MGRIKDFAEFLEEELVKSEKFFVFAIIQGENYFLYHRDEEKIWGKKWCFGDITYQETPILNYDSMVIKAIEEEVRDDVRSGFYKPSYVGDILVFEETNDVTAETIEL